jgi:hypothetical protein
MEVTMTELALFIWAIAVTAAWQQAKHDLKVFKFTTAEIFHLIAKGKVKVVESEDSFEIERV